MTEHTLPLPSAERFLQVAAGSSAWTEPEHDSRSQSPRWIIHESESFITLALLHTDSEEVQLRLRKALTLVSELPDAELQNRATDYLKSLIPDEHIPDFEAAFSAILSGNPPHESSPPENRGHKSSQPDATTAVAALDIQPRLRWSYRHLLTPIAIVAAVAAIMLFLLPSTKDLQFPDATIVASLTFPDRDPSRSASQDIYSDDEVVYKADITTEDARAWLIHMNDNDLDIQIRPDEKHPDPFHLEIELGREARHCIDYFVVIVADGNAISDVKAERLWLFDLQTELQTFNFQNDPTTALAEDAVHRYLKKSGYTGRAKVSVERFQHYLQPLF